ncbi:MAG TPA: aminopeptidase [Bacteroidetes bacterium]|nr:aminopeptidase [Bacteroidota bacterium]
MKCLKNLIVFILLLINTAVYLRAQKTDIYNRPVRVERSHDYDALHYRAEFSFNMEAKQLIGSNKMTVRALRNDFDRCLFDAGFNISIDEITDESGNSLEFNHKEDKVMVLFEDKYKYNDTISFLIRYTAVDPENDQKIFYEASENYPAMIWGPNFPNRVRNWMPCYDFPNDKVTHEMIIHAPEGFKAVSNGELQRMTHEDSGSSVWHWKQDLPHSTYLFVLAVAPYVVYEDALGDLPVNYWVFPKDSASAFTAFGRTPEIIEFFNELFGFEYPWAKCDQVMIPPMGGAAESTTATLYSNGMIVNMDEKGLKDYSFDRIIAHETAHHWWGDLITLRTWSQTWLNESFGTYCDYIWTNRVRGKDEGMIDLEGKKNAYLNEAHSKYIRPIVFDRYELASPGQNFDRHTYQKGALMLHLLRSILGDDLYFRTISYFLHKHAFEPVDTHDFMKAIKEITGQNLDWFFEQFFFRPGHPVFEVIKTWNSNENVLSIKVSQVQDTTHGVPYAFRIPVKIGLYLTDGKKVKQLWLNEREEVFEFSLDEEPKMVKFDDDGLLLKELRYAQGTDELLFKLDNDDIIGRAEAAAELSGDEITDEVKKALMATAQNDASWYVRKAAIESLEKSGYERINILCKKMALDSSSQVRVSAIRILGDTGDKRMIRFLKERFENDDSYRVQAECIISIGKCGSEKDIEFVGKAAKVTSTRNVIANAALSALNELEKK